MTPLTKRDYLLYNQMVTRIRTLEAIAIRHFFGGNSDSRASLVKRVNKKILYAHSDLFPVIDPGNTSGGTASVSTIGVGTVGSDPVVGHGCAFPYCPSGGVCVMCGGYEDIQNELLDEHS